MKARNRVMNWIATNAPALNTVPVAAMRRSQATRRSGERLLHREMAATPNPLPCRRAHKGDNTDTAGGLMHSGQRERGAAGLADQTD
jgi:hypothetical protein